MKKIALILILFLGIVAVAFAAEGQDSSEQEIRHFQLQNTFLGFGTGSRHQGDTDSSRLLLGLDIAGTTLTVSGGLGLAGSILMYDMIKGYIGDVTKADIYISAGVLGVGLVTLIISKVMGIELPLKF